ncbi:MAG: hypothetical protein LBR56_02495 [Sporomusaceae bacterium]|jgi:hypothetical protein|nr:hypothetical protein [Sporomusaceae bacterium]
MNIQGSSFNAPDFSVFGKSNKAAEKSPEEKEGAVNNISFAKTQQKYITSLQEQITKVRNDENLDEKTKKAKITELEQKILEAMKEMQAEAARKKKEEEEKKKVDTSNSLYETENEDGDTLTISKQVHLLMQASSSIDAVQNAHGIVRPLEAQKNRLEGEQKREQSGEKYRAAQIADLTGQIDSAKKTFVDALTSANEMAKELSDANTEDKNQVEEEENKDNRQNAAE